MEGLLECASCGENFDLDRRRPKLLACGHTFCHTCVRRSVWKGRLTCPIDEQGYLADPEHAQDDLQLVCWLEAAAQGVLECVCCGCPYDWVLRRPAALDCGHVVCRVCLQEANDASSRDSPLLHLRRRLSARRDSVDESWDYYSQEDGSQGTGSSLSSLPSDDAGEGLVSVEQGESQNAPLVLLMDCPMTGCWKGVRVRDHQHILGCLDGTAARASRVSRRRAVSYDTELRAEVARKLALLEERVMGCAPAVPEVGVDAAALVPVVDSRGKTSHTSKDQFDGADLKALLFDLRRVIEHKNSPRSEQPTVLSYNTAVNSLPDLILNEKSQTSIISGKSRDRDDFYAPDNLKLSKVEVDVWEMSLSNPQEMRVKKEKLLHSNVQVWKLTGLDCWCDPEWTLRLLRKVAPHVEELQLRYPNREHLQLVRDAMPHLRRLEVRGWSGLNMLEKPFDFEEGPVQNKNTLEWAEVFLPKSTAVSLLRAHRYTLRKLRLVVSDEWTLPKSELSECAFVPEVVEVPYAPIFPDAIDGFSLSEDDEGGFCVVSEDCLASRCWDDLLREYGQIEGEEEQPHALSSLALLWPSSQHHDFYLCRRFARDLRAARPYLAVECDMCRQVQDVE